MIEAVFVIGTGILCLGIEFYRQKKEKRGFWSE